MVNVGLLTRKTLRELGRSRAQTLALVSVLALGVATFVAAVGAYLDLDTSETRTFERLRFADAWFELEPTGSSVIENVATRPGVAAAAGRLVVDTGLPIDSGDRVRARLIGVPTGKQTVNDVLVVDGRPRRTSGEVLVERHFAKARGIDPGDTITPLVNGKPLPLRVAGTVASPEYLQVTPDRYELLPAPSSFAVLFIDLAELQQATGRAGALNDLAVRLDADAPATTVDDLEASLRDQRLLRQTTRRVDQATYAALEQDLAAFRSIAVSIPTLILLAGVMSVAVLLGRIVRTQRPLIGVMKAIGYHDGAVLRHYLTYALVIGAAGTIVGVLAGTALGGVITRGYANELGIPFTDTSFHPVIAAIAAVLTLLAVAAAGARPAWRSARIAPATAVRVDIAAATPTRLGRIERHLRLPLALRLPLRTIRRARGRAVSTGIGIVTAFVLVLMVLGLRDGIDLFLERTFDDLERWDIATTFDVPQPTTVADQVAGLEGVHEVSPYLQLPASITTPGAREDVLLTALDPAQRLRALRLDGITPAAALADNAIVLTDAIAADLDVAIGDRVTVATPAGSHELRVGATSDEPIPARAYLSLATAAAIAGTDTPPVNGLYLRVDPTAAGAIRAQLFDLPGVESVKLRQEQRDDLQSLLAIFTAVIAIMLTFAVAMAFALVFNAMTINVLEREREYATMRSLGTRPASIGRLLATEGVLLWLLALAPGLALGTWVAGRLGEAVAAGLFDLPVRITPVSYLGTALGLLVVILLALGLPLRRVARLDLASATKTLA